MFWSVEVLVSSLELIELVLIIEVVFPIVGIVVVVVVEEIVDSIVETEIGRLMVVGIFFVFISCLNFYVFTFFVCLF